MADIPKVVTADEDIQTGYVVYFVDADHTHVRIADPSKPFDLPYGYALAVETASAGEQVMVVVKNVEVSIAPEDWASLPEAIRKLFFPK